MAAVVRVKVRNVTPAGYEFNDKGVLLEDVAAGDELVNSATGWSKAPVDALEAHGIALMDGYAGQRGASIGLHGELDGFSGLTPGAPLYPSTSVAGGLDTSPIVGATIRVRAATATRIRFSYV